MNEPRFFVDHGTIHDRVTGKHVELEQAAALLSDESTSDDAAHRRIAWGVVVELGAMLKNAEHDRDRLKVALSDIELASFTGTQTAFTRGDDAGVRRASLFREIRKMARAALGEP